MGSLLHGDVYVMMYVQQHRASTARKKTFSVCLALHHVVSIFSSGNQTLEKRGDSKVRI